MISGNGRQILNCLETGLIDFGLVLQEPDSARYGFLPVRIPDKWGVLMPRDCPLAGKDSIDPENLAGLPLLVSSQEDEKRTLDQLLSPAGRHPDIVLRYNLIYNAALFVKAGLGYAVCYDSLINTEGTSLCFRPFRQEVAIPGYILWKKHQGFSRAAALFLKALYAAAGKTED